LAYSARDIEAYTIEQSTGHAHDSLIGTPPQNMNPGPHQSIPPALTEFARLFNRGDYWESHEILEAVWKESRSDFYHGLILLASAFVHGERKNRHGVLAQLDKAEAVLRRFGPHFLGVDLDKTLGLAEGLRARAEAGLTDPGEPARLTLDPGLVRGDEPELSFKP
jgi:hypothetical protein